MTKLEKNIGVLVCGVIFQINWTAWAIRPPTASEVVGSCEATGTFVTHPQDLVSKVARDADDFQRFPDKSKLPQQNFTADEVSRYDGRDGRRLYIIVCDRVYDVTDFADFHPAGPEPLQSHAGEDCTELMRATGMPPLVYRLIDRFRVGDLVPGTADE